MDGNEVLGNGPAGSPGNCRSRDRQYTRKDGAREFRSSPLRVMIDALHYRAPRRGIEIHSMGEAATLLGVRTRWRLAALPF